MLVEPFGSNNTFLCDILSISRTHSSAVIGPKQPEVAGPWDEASLLPCDGGFSLLRAGRPSFESDSDFEDVAEPRRLALSRPNLELTLTRA